MFQLFLCSFEARNLYLVATFLCWSVCNRFFVRMFRIVIPVNLLTSDGERLDDRTLIVVLSNYDNLVGSLFRTTFVGYGIVVLCHEDTVCHGHFRFLYLFVIDKGGLVEGHHCVSQRLRVDDEGLHLFTGIVAHTLDSNRCRTGIHVIVV